MNWFKSNWFAANWWKANWFRGAGTPAGVGSTQVGGRHIVAEIYRQLWEQEAARETHQRTQSLLEQAQYQRWQARRALDQELSARLIERRQKQLATVTVMLAEL